MAELFLGDAAQASDAFQVNQTTAGNQQNAKVSMDAAGDFTVTWESNQSGNYDIYARRYARTSQVQYAAARTPRRRCCWSARIRLYGANGEIGGEFRVNTTTATGRTAIPHRRAGRHRRRRGRLERLRRDATGIPE